MPLPFHLYGSVPLAGGATTLHRALTATLTDRVSTATASALTALGPQITRWGLTVTALPTTTTRMTNPHELGGGEVTWHGDEAATGWPALTGRLVITPQSRHRARLLLLSHRSPDAELATDRIDRLHRRRIVEVSVQRFLHELARNLDGDTGDTAASDGVTRAFDRSPLFLHHLQDLDTDPDTARGWLLTGLDDLATHATTVAISRAHAALEAGRFRSPAQPRVQARPARPQDPATAWIRWTGDEEATGWPQLDLSLLVQAHGDRAALAVLSAREPSYDLSRNRIDKHQRHQILQQAGAALAAALTDQLPATITRRPGQPRELVSARS